MKWASQTIASLDDLAQRFQMTDMHFLKLHHFGLPGSRSGTSILRHRDYCQGGAKVFHAHGENVDVLRRLLLVRYLREEGVAWDPAISAAVAAFPFK